MKHFKEIRVAVLAIIAMFALYFGFNYLKGINVFHKTSSYVAVFPQMDGLVEQSPVYVRGYKVGMVETISYNFQQDDAFTVSFSINPDIVLPYGTKVALVADGLISGEALELRIPTGDSIPLLAHATSSRDSHFLPGDTIPSQVEPGMIAGITAALTSQLDPILNNLDSILLSLKNNLSDEKLASVMNNVDGTMSNAKDITRRFDRMMANEVPAMLDSIQLVLTDVHQITTNLAEADFKATILKLDTTINGVNQFVDKVNSTDGTIGMLLNDKDLYVGLNNTVTSADSLLTDLKANPKRYVHFSLFGRKDKK